MFSQVVVQTVSNHASLENFLFIAKSSVILCKPRSPQAIARKLASNRNVEREILKIVVKPLQHLSHLLFNI